MHESRHIRGRNGSNCLRDSHPLPTVAVDLGSQRHQTNPDIIHETHVRSVLGPREPYHTRVLVCIPFRMRIRMRMCMRPKSPFTVYNIQYFENLGVMSGEYIASRVSTAPPTEKFKFQRSGQKLKNSRSDTEIKLRLSG